MSYFLTLKNPPEENAIKLESRPIKLNLFDENDLPCYPIYEIFNEKFPDFICQICLFFVIDPVECLTCNSIFCKKCLYEYTLYSKHCPNRCDINYRPVNRILKNLINAVKVPCIFYHKGCKEILNYESYYSHLKNCNFSPYMCNQCYLVDVKENVENHCKICKKKKLKDFSNNNRKRFVCKYCNIEIISFEEKQFWYDEFKINKYVRKFLIHEYLCNEQIVFCNFCEKDFRLYDFMKHTENNVCLINQLNNKISYLTHKIDYYESNIKNKKIINDEEELKNYKEMTKITKVEIPYSKRYGITQSLITNQIKQEEKNEIKNEEKRIKKEKFMKENSLYEQISKNIIKEVNLKSKKFNEKNKEISTLLIENTQPNQENNNNNIKYGIISALKNSFILIKDSLDESNIIESTEYNIENLTSEILSKSNNKYNKKNEASISITHILMTQLNKKRDIFIATDSNFYFLFNNNFSSLIKSGRPTSTSITCLTEVLLPNKKYFIALGTYSSNVQLLLPYDNKILYTLNHTKKRIISLCYDESSSTLIVSSAKENAFYLWKYSLSKDIFELKSTIKDNDMIWSLVLTSIQNIKYKYIITGVGDKTINIWEFFSEENAAMKKLSIKSHHESVVKVKAVSIRNNCVIISGAFDGTVKIHEIKRSFNDEFGEINLVYKELFTIYNKDSEIINLEYFYYYNDNNLKKDIGDDEELDLIINLAKGKGYSLHKLIFKFN